MLSTLTRLQRLPKNTLLLPPSANSKRIAPDFFSRSAYLLPSVGFTSTAFGRFRTVFSFLFFSFFIPFSVLYATAGGFPAFLAASFRLGVFRLTISYVSGPLPLLLVSGAAGVVAVHFPRPVEGVPSLTAFELTFLAFSAAVASKLRSLFLSSLSCSSQLRLQLTFYLWRLYGCFLSGHRLFYLTKYYLTFPLLNLCRLVCVWRLMYVTRSNLCFYEGSGGGTTYQRWPH